MGKGWGYNHSTSTFAEEMQRNKQLINRTELGTNIYKSTIGNGIFQTVIYLHDNRKNNLPTMLIIKDQDINKAYNITDLKTFKAIYQYAEQKLNELDIIRNI
jgi:hypothetical protein